MVNTISRLGPGHTPKIVGKLILAIIVVSLFSALWESLFSILLGAPPLQAYLALSRWGISHYFIWQFVSYLFVINSSGLGITLFYLIYLFFSMYLLWIMGSSICEFGGSRHFLQLFFTSGVVAGVVGIFIMWIGNYQTYLAGPEAALLALFTVWSLLNPEMEVLLFFILPVRIKWLFAAVVGAVILINLSQFDIVKLFFYLTGIIAGYIFAAMSWELGSPFPVTEGIDRRLVHLGRRMRGWHWKPREKSGSKIVQLFSGKPHLDDDAFIDAMLSKISQKGQDSLTWAEKKRMDEIAKKHQH